MQAKLVLLTLAGLLSGCLGTTAPADDAGASIDARTPQGAEDRTSKPASDTQGEPLAGDPAVKQFTVYPTKSESMTFQWAGGQLNGRIKTTASFYLDMRMDLGCAQGGAGAVNLMVAVGGTNTVGFSCGHAAAGTYTLTWTTETGYATGELVVPGAVLA